MNLAVSSQLFMKNGITPSSDDLKVITVQRNLQIINISLTSNLVACSGNIEGVEISTDYGLITLVENRNQLTIDFSKGLVKVLPGG